MVRLKIRQKKNFILNYQMYKKYFQCNIFYINILYMNSNNIHGKTNRCPALMDDSRLFTTHISTNKNLDYVKQINGLPNDNNQVRSFLINNSNPIIKNTQSFNSINAKCKPFEYNSSSINDTIEVNDDIKHINMEMNSPLFKNDKFRFNPSNNINNRFFIDANVDRSKFTKFNN